MSDWSSPGPGVSDLDVPSSTSGGVPEEDSLSDVDRSSGKRPEVEHAPNMVALMIPGMSLQVLLKPKLEVVDMSKPCASFFSQLSAGNTICECLKDADVISAWLRFVSDAVVDGRVPLPSIIKYGPVSIRESDGGWYCASLEVLFPRTWTLASPTIDLTFKPPDPKTCISWTRPARGRRRNNQSCQKMKAKDTTSPSIDANSGPPNDSSRSTGRSVVNDEPMGQSPCQVLSSEHESSGPGPEPEAAARLLLQLPTTQAAQADEVNSDKEVSDSDVVSADICAPNSSVSSRTFVTGKQRKNRINPCKWRRERYQKLVTRLVEQHKKAPGRFDIASVQLPPSISTPDEVAKLDQRVRGRFQKERGMQLEHSESHSMSAPQDFSARGSDATSSSDALPVSLAHARGLMSHGSEAPAGERGNAHFEECKVVRGSLGRQGAQSGEDHRDMPTDGGKQQPSRATHGELLYHQGQEIEGLTEGQASFQRAWQHADPGMHHNEGENVSLQGRDGTVTSLSNSLSRDRSAAPHGYDMEGHSSLRPPLSRRPLQLAGHGAPSSFQALAGTEDYGAQDDFSAAPRFSGRHHHPAAPGDQFIQGDGLSSLTMSRPHLQPSSGGRQAREHWAETWQEAGETQ